MYFKLLDSLFKIFNCSLKSSWNIINCAKPLGDWHEQWTSGSLLLGHSRSGVQYDLIVFRSKRLLKHLISIPLIVNWYEDGPYLINNWRLIYIPGTGGYFVCDHSALIMCSWFTKFVFICIVLCNADVM